MSLPHPKIRRHIPTAKMSNRCYVHSKSENLGRMTNFCLTAKGLKNVAGETFPNDFTFTVGSATYFCSSFVACFLSPKIATIRRCDPTIASYAVETKDETNEFRSVLSLGEGSSLVLQQSMKKFLLNISTELENTELYELVLNSFDGKLEGEDVEAVLNEKFRRGLNCEKELSDLASHFWENGTRIIHKFSSELLCGIMKSGGLVIESEDWLFEQVLNVIEDDPTKFCLFEFVYFELVSCENLKRFVSLSSDCLCLINSAIWTRLCNRLALPIGSRATDEIRSKVGNRYKEPRQAFPFRVGSPFEGIFAHLSSKCGGNVHDKGIVDISSSSAYSDGWKGKFVVDFNSSQQFCSGGQPGSWICFDFKNMKVLATQYSIKSRSDAGPGGLHPKSWVIEVSDDKNSWSVVDEKVGNGDLNGLGSVKTFKVDTPKAGQYLRMRQTGLNHCNSHYFSFGKIELFGNLVNKS
jgi:hypothetical protein